MARRGPARRAPERGKHRLFWACLAAPGILWLALLFIVPFYVVLSIAAGRLNQLFGTPIAVYNPLSWSTSNLAVAWRDIAGPTAYVGPILLRTVIYTAAAAALSLLIGYPVAYFVARFAGKRRGLMLVLLIAPFWISYMMRMLAWVDLLQTNGYVNSVLTFLHLASHPVNWLSGQPVTVVLGLVYGYIPYVILVLYAGLEQPIMTAMLITVLPMLGDYFTNQLLSGATNTSMIGNVIDQELSTPLFQGEGAVFSVFLLLILVVPMVYYVASTNRTGREAV